VEADSEKNSELGTKMEFAKRKEGLGVKEFELQLDILKSEGPKCKSGGNCFYRGIIFQ
jgi:hypothetical protein